MYKLNRERLMIGLRAAYTDACRSKRNKMYVKRFVSWGIMLSPGAAM